MRYSASKLAAGIVLLAGTVGLGQVAEAQMGPGSGARPILTQPTGEQKKDGAAADASPAIPLLPTTPALPPTNTRRKKWKLLELDGYYRVRTDWFKNFNLGFNDNASAPTLGGAPFQRPISCFSTTLNHPCGDTLTDTNMRLRLEPTFNLDEGTSVHVQADVLDNLVLGSTPTGMDLSGVYTTTNLPPLGVFGNTQATPSQGVNSANDPILIKRAWAEVAVPFGILKAGRQPNQWGMGIWANAGGYDPINGTYNYDADSGDNVDRVSFTAQIPGTPLRAMIAADWDLTRLISSQTSANTGNTAQSFGLDNASNTNGYVGVISKMESATQFKEAVERGDNVLDYGLYFEYKHQGWDEDLTGFKIGGPLAPTATVPRDARLYTPDLWARFGAGPFLLEGEVVGQFGSIQSLTDLGITTPANTSTPIRKLGGVGRFTWTGVEGKLRMGVETGFASGDQWDNNPQGNTNIAYANLLGDPKICDAKHSCTLTQFVFNQNYFVDMILWRRLIGAVTNAVYIKPFLQYDLTKSIMFKVANITSFALNAVATPGNANVYGTEFDTDIGYHDSHIFAGISYGILFPFRRAVAPGVRRPRRWHGLQLRHRHLRQPEHGRPPVPRTASRAVWSWCSRSFACSAVRRRTARSLRPPSMASRITTLLSATSLVLGFGCTLVSPCQGQGALRQSSSTPPPPPPPDAPAQTQRPAPTTNETTRSGTETASVGTSEIIACAKQSARSEHRLSDVAEPSGRDDRVRASRQIRHDGRVDRVSVRGRADVRRLPATDLSRLTTGRGHGRAPPRDPRCTSRRRCRDGDLGRSALREPERAAGEAVPRRAAATRRRPSSVCRDRRHHDLHGHVRAGQGQPRAIHARQAVDVAAGRQLARARTILAQLEKRLCGTKHEAARAVVAKIDAVVHEHRKEAAAAYALDDRINADPTFKQLSAQEARLQAQLAELESAQGSADEVCSGSAHAGWKICRTKAQLDDVHYRRGQRMDALAGTK